MQVAKNFAYYAQPVFKKYGITIPKKEHLFEVAMSSYGVLTVLHDGEEYLLTVPPDNISILRQLTGISQP